MTYKKSVIVSPDIYNDTTDNLKNMGIDIIYSMQNQNVSDKLKFHADMQIAKLSDTDYVCAPECFDYYKKALSPYNVNLISGNTYLSCNYPYDIAYNIIITNSYAFHNFKYTDSIIKQKLGTKKLINVSQGYTACILCNLGNGAFITSDMGIYKTLIKNNFDVLFIDDSDILLPGYNHGFFGGSSFMINRDTLAVNGNAKYHRNYDDIRAFCKNYDISLVSLSNSPIMDIGSFISV